MGGAALLALFLLFTAVRTGPPGERSALAGAVRRDLARVVKDMLYHFYCPSLSFLTESRYESGFLLQGQIDTMFPFYGYVVRDMEEPEGEGMEETAGRNELTFQGVQQETDRQASEQQTAEQQADADEQTIADLLRAENEAAMHAQENAALFVPHERQVQVDLGELEEYDTLVNAFYTVDANTMVGSDQLDVGTFLDKDLRVDRSGEGPQILIYHTHSKEGFVDSVPGDSATTIVGVGDRLTEILTKDYGFNVLHHTASYDAPGRDDAYSRALPEIQKILAENPTIQVIIDLHRDEMPAGTRLVTDLDGRPTARFMFFNGLSRTKKTGNIAYLRNENLAGNLAFSFRMQLKAAEHYPGLTRKIYLKGYRYNMHLLEKSLLIELGAQNNTVEEAMNACDPLAHVLSMVLSGE